MLIYQSGVQSYTGGLTEPWPISIKCVGGRSPRPIANGQPNTATNYFGGYISDFRIYHRNNDVVTSPANEQVFNGIQAGIDDFWDSGTAGNRDYTLDYLNSPITNDLISATESNLPKYCNYGYIDPNDEICAPTLVKERTWDNWSSDYPLLRNVYFSPFQQVPDANRYLGADISLEMISNKGAGPVGWIQSGALDNLDFQEYDEDEDLLLGKRNDNSDDSTIIYNYINGDSTLSIQDKVFNVEIKNLPHQTYNGVNGNLDKTIYQVNANPHTLTDNNVLVSNITPPTKLWHELNNAGDIVLNELEVQISDEEGKKETDLLQETHLTIEIREKKEVQL